MNPASGGGGGGDNRFVRVDAEQGLNPYCGDGYPREGCVIGLRARADGDFNVTISSPAGALMETYFDVLPIERVQEAIERWMRGEMPIPRGGFMRPSRDQK